jgi:hypothetical protein
MHNPGDINHVHGLYRSSCCGVEHSLPDNVKFHRVRAVASRARVDALAKVPPGSWCV